MYAWIRNNSLLSYFLLAYLFSWVIWMPLYLQGFEVYNLYILPFHHALGALGPFISAFLISYICDGKQGISILFQKLIHWRVKWGWYAIALFSPFLIFLVAVLMTKELNGKTVELSALLQPEEFSQFNFFTFFLYNLFSFGYGEETGWRGFALERLQKKFSPLVSTFILSLLWAGWHIPLFLYRPGYTGMDLAGMAGWFFSIYTGAVLLTWLYNKTKGSILIVAIFHSTIDIAFTSVRDTDIMNYMGFMITMWGLVTFLFIYKEQREKKV